MRFEFAAPARIIFGPGTASQLGPLARDLGRRAVVCTGLPPDRTDTILASLPVAGIDYVTLTVTGEPTTDFSREGTRLAVKFGEIL